MDSTNYIIQSTDFTKLNFRHWKVVNPKYCVCIIHGLGEHSGRYHDWANRFVTQNIAVCAIDLRGHGLSDGIRGHAKSYEVLYNDIELLLVEANTHYPTAQKILYGHSLGGNIAISYLLSRKPLLSGLIITSPWFKLATIKHSIKDLLASFLCKFIPFITVNNELNPNDLSRNLNVVAAYTSDKLVHDRISIKLYINAKHIGFRVSSKGYQVNMPLLLMHGDADNITSFKASNTFALNTGRYTTFKSWSGAYHELHNEPNGAEIFNYIVNWIDKNLIVS